MGPIPRVCPTATSGGVSRKSVGASDNLPDRQFATACGCNNFTLSKNWARPNGNSDAKNVDAGGAAKKTLHGIRRERAHGLHCPV